MGLFKYFLSGPRIGLDLYSNEIRLLQLRHKKDRWVIEKSAMIPLPYGAMIERKIQQPEVVMTHLQALVQETDTHGARVTIGLPIQSVISKKIPVSELGLLRHVNDYFPGMNEVLAYDYLKMDEDVLLIATRHDELMNYIRVIEGAGLKLSIVDVDVYALVRAAHFAIKSKKPIYPIFLLECHDTVTQFIIFDEKEIRYQKTMYGLQYEVMCQLKSFFSEYFSTEKKTSVE